MSLFKKVFIVNTNDKPWYQIVLWWEIRRLVYNTFLILFAILSIYLCSKIPGEGYIQLYPGPSLIFWFLAITISYLLAANILYTFGWITQIFTRKLNNKFVQKLVPILFILGLIFSFIITLIPCILVLLNIILPDELIDIFYSSGLRLFDFILNI